MTLVREFNLQISEKSFLTVCGKCGGKIERIKRDDVRLVDVLICQLVGQYSVVSPAVSPIGGVRESTLVRRGPCALPPVFSS